MNTSGRAVLFAGIIVCIALLGLFALGVSFLYGLAVAAAIGVALTMVAALTLLPALLGFIGPKVMSRKQKRNLAENGPRIVGADSKGFWPKWADRVQRYPWVSAGVALVILVAIALPFFSLRLGSADQGTDPAGTPTRVAFDTLAQGVRPGLQRAPPAGRGRAAGPAPGHRQRRARRLRAAGRRQGATTDLHPEQDGQRRRRPGQRLSGLRAPGRGDDRPGEPSPRPDRPQAPWGIPGSTCSSAARRPSTSTSPTC